MKKLILIAILMAAAGTVISQTQKFFFVSGTPTLNQYAQWVDDTTLKGVASVDTLATGAVDAIGEIASGLKSGVDLTLVTGTAGTSTWVPQWNGDGDLVDGQRVLGTQSIWIPAQSWITAPTDGAGALIITEITAYRPSLIYRPFDDTVSEGVEFPLRWPRQWDEGTVTFQVQWASLTPVTTGTSWGFYGVCFGDGDNRDVAFPSAVTVQDDAQGVASDTLVTPISSAVTFGGTPQPGDLCVLKIYRDVAHANDDLVGDAAFEGLTLFWTNAALTDD